MSRRSRLSTLRDPSRPRVEKLLRSNLTEAERRLWYFLRASRFQEWKFRRQVPLGAYVVDFLCEEARLIVEVDGGQHNEQSAEDEARTRWLNEKGYEVVRYWNNDVFENIEGVLTTLSLALSQGRGKKSRPSPRPSPKGEGESH